MKFNVHAGHCPDGGTGSGAASLIKESTHARAVKDALIAKLKAAGHTAYDCTCDSNVSASSCLTKIVAMCNAHDVDLDVSIHLNAGASDTKGNGSTTGVEVLVYSTSSAAAAYATKICNQIAADMDYKNRGVKVRTDLYVLRKTSSPALLVECCFVDDADDVAKWDADKCADAIFTALTGSVSTTETNTDTSSSSSASVSTTESSWVMRLQAECNEQGFSEQSVDGIAGPITLAGCPTMKAGTEGDITKLLQERLINLGYSCGSWGADGVFGDDTTTAVKLFQKANGLTADGAVGPNTWSALLGLS